MPGPVRQPDGLCPCRVAAGRRSVPRRSAGSMQRPTPRTCVGGTLDTGAYGSPIFKVVPQKRCKALYTALTESLKSLEYAVGGDSERSHVDRSVAVHP